MQFNGDVISERTVRAGVEVWVVNAATKLGKDGSGNLVLTDAVTGSKTLAQLAEGGGAVYVPNHTYAAKGMAGDNITINHGLALAGAPIVQVYRQFVFGYTTTYILCDSAYVTISEINSNNINIQNEQMSTQIYRVRITPG